MENTIKFITLLNRERECGIFRSMAEIYFMQNKEIVIRVAHVDHDLVVTWPENFSIFPYEPNQIKSNNNLFSTIIWKDFMISHQQYIQFARVPY